MQYNDSQKKAIAHMDGPMLVLAGPGSGKTAVITGRTVNLIKNGISPSSILVVTFTRAAAREMKERFLKLCADNLNESNLEKRNESNPEKQNGSNQEKLNGNNPEKQNRSNLEKLNGRDPEKLNGSNFKNSGNRKDLNAVCANGEAVAGIKNLRDARLVTFGTFHGVFYGILKNSYHISGSNILPEGQKLKLIREILLHMCPEAGQEADLPSSVIREISQVKGSEADINNFYSAVLPQDAFRNVYRAYEDWKRENRQMDFDDIITGCYRLFRERPDVLRRWQEKFRYLLIDEFQDISPLQYKIIRLLAEPENNLFIVGDDDQSIYRFRGANPEIMLRFPKDYREAEVVALEENYRSTPEILASAGMLISKNKKRFMKRIHAASSAGDPVTLDFFDNPRKECIHLAEAVREEHGSGTPYEEMAVLFRTNAGCREAVEQLMAYGIPFRAADIIPCIYDHWIAKDIFAYMDLGKGSGARSDFLRVYNRPNRYISRMAFDKPVMSFDGLFEYYEDKDWMCRRVEQWEADEAVLGRLAPYGAVHYIRHEIGYDDFVKEYAEKHHVPMEELTQILDELAESARNYSTYEEWEKAIAEYREKLERQKKQLAGTGDGVVISTLHASKGMEYDTVYILDVNEGVIPYHKAVLAADLEEERRMFYVGMTRARKHLHLYAVRERYDKKMEPSRFLRELGYMRH